MKKRIKRHRNERKLSGYDWKTIEITDQFYEKVIDLNIEGIVLLDCLTVLTANELFAKPFTEEEIDAVSEAVKMRLLDGLRVLRDQAVTLIVVSNEIHYEWNNDLYVQAYQRLLGQLHQQIVTESTKSYLVESSIPILMKEMS